MYTKIPPETSSRMKFFHKSKKAFLFGNFQKNFNRFFLENPAQIVPETLPLISSQFSSGTLSAVDVFQFFIQKFIPRFLKKKSSGENHIHLKSPSDAHPIFFTEFDMGTFPSGIIPKNPPRVHLKIFLEILPGAPTQSPQMIPLEISQRILQQNLTRIASDFFSINVFKFSEDPFRNSSRKFQKDSFLATMVFFSNSSNESGTLASIIYSGRLLGSFQGLALIILISFHLSTS